MYKGTNSLKPLEPRTVQHMLSTINKIIKRKLVSNRNKTKTTYRQDWRESWRSTALDVNNEPINNQSADGDDTHSSLAEREPAVFSTEPKCRMLIWPLWLCFLLAQSRMRVSVLTRKLPHFNESLCDYASSPSLQL